MSAQATQNLSTGRLIEPKQVPEGFLFVAPGNRFTPWAIVVGCLCLFLWFGISFVVCVIVLFSFPRNPSLIMLAFWIPMVFGGWLASLLMGLVRVPAGQIVLPSYPLRMGESCSIRYRRRLRWRSTPRPGKITAKWRCYEWVEYGPGTDLENEVHTLWETELPETLVASGIKLVGYETQIVVRPQGPPSLDAKYNQVRWELEVNVDLPGVVKDTAYVCFRVVPEVMQ